MQDNKPEDTATGAQTPDSALRESEQRFRFAIQAGRMFSYEWDLLTDALVRDQESADILGLTGDVRHTTGQAVMATIHPDDRPAILAAVTGLSPENSVYRATMRVLRPDGGIVWLERTGRGFFTGERKLVRMIGMAVDVTERKRMEETLRQREGELLEAQRVAEVGSWHWNVETDEVTWSEELYRIAGRDLNEPAVAGKGHPQLYTPESWERLQIAAAEALRNGTPYALDAQMLRPDGTIRWIRARGEAQRDVTGRVVALRGTAQDITERKLAEETLKESEERFRSVFRDAGIGMVVVSPEGRFIAVNGTFCEYLGYTEEELFKQPVESLTHPDDWPSFSRALHNALTNGQNFRLFEKRCIHKSGRIVWTESSGSVIRTLKGEIKYLVGEVVDVTQRKLADEALSNMNRKLIEGQEQERSRIARELHDDIIQSMAVLRIRMQKMKTMPPGSPDEFRAGIAELVKQVDEISASVQSLSHGLHSSKLEYLGITTAMASFCSEYGADHMVDIQFSHEAVRSDIPAEISLCLFRVLQEALQNAVKHSGVKRFEAQLFGTADEIVMRISDAGLGFDPEAAMSRWGLGLISMRERLRLVQGEISVSSKANEGTTIVARVPLISKLKLQSRSV